MFYPDLPWVDEVHLVHEIIHGFQFLQNQSAFLYVGAKLSGSTGVNCIVNEKEAFCYQNSFCNVYGGASNDAKKMKIPNIEDYVNNLYKNEEGKFNSPEQSLELNEILFKNKSLRLSILIQASQVLRLNKDLEKRIPEKAERRNIPNKQNSKKTQNKSNKKPNNKTAQKRYSRPNKGL
jgi:hypothetical protein